jgi:hypothetical protein
MRSERSWLVALCLLTCSEAADAQLLNSLFPAGVPGYGAEQGVTVQSRARPAFDPLEIRDGIVRIKPLADFSIGYDDNIFGGPARHGAWELAARPSVLIGAENSSGSVGLSASGDDIHYINAPSQDRTDGSLFVGGTFNVDRDKLTLGAGHLSQHEDRTELDAIPSDRPIGFTVENLRLAYAADIGRLTATPSIELNRWRFQNTTIDGLPVSEAARDRTTAQVGLTLRYGWMPGRDLLLVTRFLNTRYDFPAAGVASNNSISGQILAGVDYDDNTVWRYRLLGGLQHREAVAGSDASETTGIAEGEIIWSPSGMTTVRASLTRGIEDAAQSGLFSYTYTSAQVTLDYEYARDILLTLSAGARDATFNQTGGHQGGLAFGGGATWLINRTLRLGLTYDFADVRNTHISPGTVAGDYTRSLTLLTMRVAM